MTRWATFDCYGTLIDWNGGLSSALAALWPEQETKRLLERYHEIEPRVQLDGSLSYREVLRDTLRLLAEDEDLTLPPGEEDALAASLPSWPAFPEVPGALAEVRRRGFRLAILSNVDPDLLAASLERVGVPVDGAVTAAEAGSYKPRHGHWERFFERFGAERERVVHVAASAYHDLGPAAELGLLAVWINRLADTSEAPRAAELEDLSGLAGVLESLLPVGAER